MRRHLVGKAAVLLVVAMFHCFVLVPRAHTFTAPSVAAVIGAARWVFGNPLVIGAVLLTYTAGKILMKRSYTDRVRSSGQLWQAQQSGPLTVGYTNYRITEIAQGACGSGYVRAAQSYPNSLSYKPWSMITSCSNNPSQVAASLASWLAANPPGTLPIDYALFPSGSDGSYTNPPALTSAPDNVVPMPYRGEFYTSDGLEGLTREQAGSPSSYEVIGDTAVASAIGANGLVDLADSTPVVGESSPIESENAIAIAQLAAIEALRDSEAAANREATQIQVRDKLDEISTKLDNTSSGSFPQSATDALDLISIRTTETRDAVSQVSAKTDNVITKIDELKDAVTTTTATESTLTTRIAEVRDLASTKFPFSLVGAYNLTVPSGGNYTLPGWNLKYGDSSTAVTIDPFGSVLGSVFTWARTMLVYLFWASTIFMMIRRVSNL